MIISQGQIDAVLNARPEDRRLIIEEAAGVLKYRRRKEKAERRLASTEGNLTRLQDLLREVRRQLRPLERQADAARRHGSLVEELTTCGSTWPASSCRRLQARLEQPHRDPARPRRAGPHAPGPAGGARHRRARRRVPPHRAGRRRRQRRPRALRGAAGEGPRPRLAAGRAAPRASSASTERLVDQALIASLEAEAAELARELAEVDAETERVAPELDRIAALEAEVEDERTRFDATWGEAEPTDRAAQPGRRGAR